MSKVEHVVADALREALPDVPVYEGVVVEGYHPATLAGTCLECGRSEYAQGCKGEGAPPRETWHLREGDRVRHYQPDGCEPVEFVVAEVIPEREGGLLTAAAPEDET